MLCSMSNRISFVVRFIRGASEAREEWHGQVEHVQTGEKRPFKGAIQFLEQLEALSDIESNVDSEDQNKQE